MSTIRQHLLTPNGQALLTEGMSATQVEQLALQFHAGIGGAEFFERLANRFYELVASDDELGPLFAHLPAHVHARRQAAHFKGGGGQAGGRGFSEAGGPRRAADAFEARLLAPDGGRVVTGAR